MTMTQAPRGTAAVEGSLLEWRRRRRSYLRTMLVLTGVLVLSVALALSWGAVTVPLPDVWAIVVDHLRGAGDAARGITGDVIIWQIRAPRVVLAMLVGAGLAVVGVAVQAMVRNPLADPYVLGVESGAAAGAVAVIYFLGPFSVSFLSPTMGAFLGALATMALVFALARSGGRVSSLRLLLVGVALSYGLSGFTSFVLYASHDPAAQQQVMFWILGSLGGATWAQVPLVLAVVVAGSGFYWWWSRRLNALALGDASATSLGIDPNRARIVLFVVSSAMVAAIVSTVGPIGFVGLVVPHVTRMFVGAEHRRVLPASILVGASYLVVVDLFSRVVFAPSEVPIGIVTAVLGTPFFLWLLRSRGSRVLVDAS